MARGLFAILAGIAVVTGVAWLMERQETTVLRAEVEGLRDAQRELARAQAEQVALRATVVPEEELARLRADRGALVRLRGEVAALQASAEARTRALEQAPRAAGAAASTAEAPLVFQAGPDGNLSVEGRALDLAALRTRFETYAKEGRTIDVRIRLPEGVQPLPVADFERSTKQLMQVAKDVGARITVQFARRDEEAQPFTVNATRP